MNSPIMESIVKRKREKGSIYSRNKSFLEGVLKISGYYNGDWDHIRNNFDENKVKQIYDLHADIWHPNDHFKEISSDFIDKRFQRYLYVGGIEIADILNQIFRWSLYLDQILIPDPFIPTWATSNEHNPLAHPAKYELEALKMVYFLILISPLVQSGQVLLVPNPADFGPVKDKVFNIIRGQVSKITPTKRDENRLLKLIRADLLNRIARIPKVSRMDAIKQTFVGENTEEIMILTEHLRKEGMFCIDRDSFSGQMTFSERSVGFEEALLMCAFYEAVPIPCSLEARRNQFFMQSDEEGSQLALMNKHLKTFSIIEMCDPHSSTLLKGRGVAADFRLLMQDFILDENEVSIDRIGKDFAKYMQEFRDISNLLGKSIDPKSFHSFYKLRLLHSTKRFLTPEVKRVISVYDSSLLEKLPRYWLELPLSDIPDLTL